VLRYEDEDPRSFAGSKGPDTIWGTSDDIVMLITPDVSL